MKATACMAATIYAVKNSQSSSTLVSLDRNSWQPPTPRWIKINSNGATRKDAEWIAAAGVLLDSNGQWIAGYQRSIGRGTTLLWKLWGIFHGLQVVHLKGFPKVISESDCNMVLEMVKDCLKGAPAKPIVKGIVNLAGCLKVLSCSLLKEMEM